MANTRKLAQVMACGTVPAIVARQQQHFANGALWTGRSPVHRAHSAAEMVSTCSGVGFMNALVRKPDDFRPREFASNCTRA